MQHPQPAPYSKRARSVLCTVLYIAHCHQPHATHQPKLPLSVSIFHVYANIPLFTDVRSHITRTYQQKYKIKPLSVHLIEIVFMYIYSESAININILVRGSVAEIGADGMCRIYTLDFHSISRGDGGGGVGGVCGNSKLVRSGCCTCLHFIPAQGFFNN